MEVHYEEVCSVCGKRFYIGDREGWVYKQRRMKKEQDVTKWFCSWHCMRAEEKEHEKRKEERRKKYAEKRPLHRKGMD